MNPRKNAPRAILRALIASFIIGGLIMLLAMMAVTDITAPEISTGGLQYIVLDVLGNTIGDLFLWCVVIAITVCCLAVHTAAIRMMFAMARDNNLPAGEHLARIDPRTKTPIIPAVLIGVLAILILVVNIRQPQIFVVITSIGIIMIYIAYLLVTGPMLLARMRGQWRSEDAPEGYFTLGRWGFAVNVVAVDLGLSRWRSTSPGRAPSIYNATEPFHWYLKWGAVLFVGAVMIGGFAYYWFVQRHKTGTLAAHAHVDGAGRRAAAGDRRRRRLGAAVDDVAEFLRRHPPFDSLDDAERGGGGGRGRGRVAPRGRGDPRPPGRDVRQRLRRPARRGRAASATAGCSTWSARARCSASRRSSPRSRSGFVARAVEDTLVYRIPERAIRPVLERPAALRFVARALSAPLLAPAGPAPAAAAPASAASPS